MVQMRWLNHSTRCATLCRRSSLMRPRPEHPRVPPACAFLSPAETKSIVSTWGIGVQTPPCRRSWRQSVASGHRQMPQCPTASRALWRKQGAGRRRGAALHAGSGGRGTERGPKDRAGIASTAPRPDPMNAVYIYKVKQIHAVDGIAATAPGVSVRR